MMIHKAKLKNNAPERSWLITSRALRPLAALFSSGIALGCSGLMPLTPTLQHPPDPSVVIGEQAVGAPPNQTWVTFVQEISKEISTDAQVPDVLVNNCEEAHSALLSTALNGDEAQKVGALWTLAACGQVGWAPDLLLVTAVSLTDPATAAPALVMANLGLEDNGQIQDALCVLLESDAFTKEERFEAMVALDQFSWTEDDQALLAVTAAIDQYWPPLAYEAIRRAADRAQGMPADSPLRRSITTKLTDKDPAVRAQVYRFVSRANPSDLDIDLIVSGLSDPHALTRSVAAESLGELKQLRWAYSLLPLLNDTTENTWSMRPWTRPDSSEGRLDLSGSRLERVDDAALEALEQMTRDLPEGERFVRRKVNLRFKDLDLKAAARDARAFIDALDP